MSNCRFCNFNVEAYRHRMGCIGKQSKFSNPEVADLRRRLARALWALRKVHGLESGWQAKLTLCESVFTPERAELRTRRKKEGKA